MCQVLSHLWRLQKPEIYPQLKVILSLMYPKVCMHSRRWAKSSGLWHSRRWSKSSGLWHSRRWSKSSGLWHSRRWSKSSGLWHSRRWSKSSVLWHSRRCSKMCGQIVLVLLSILRLNLREADTAAVVTALFGGRL